MLDKIIATLLENQEIEAELEPPSLKAKAAAFKAFGDWLTKEAPQSLFGETFGFDHNVAEGSGVVALKDLKKDQAFMQIPRRIMLTNEHAHLAQASIAGLLASDPMLASNPSLALVLQLLHERNNPKSFWKPFLDILPVTFDLPLFFSFDELQELQGSPAGPRARRLRFAAASRLLALRRSFSCAGR